MAINEVRPLNEKPPAITKLQAVMSRLADVNGDGKVDGADAKIAGHWAWKLILLAARFLPDHTVLGRAADNVVGAVDRAGLRGEADKL
jgi:hypothetical protein